MKYFIYCLSFAVLIPAVVMGQSSIKGGEIIGKWNLTIELEDDDFPGWLEVKESGFNTLIGYYVGYEGSARPVSEVEYSEDDQKYSFSIPPQWKRIDDDLYFEFSLEDDELVGFKVVDEDTLHWTGVHAPDLVRETPPIWGEPINLLDDHMANWIIPENNKFQMKDGILVNPEAGGNLITTEKFNDFKLHTEFRYPEESNSGLYLRGRYEVQIMDTYGQKPHSRITGGVYGFIAPTVNASKRAGEWQTLDITLVGRRVTIVLNGEKVICDRPIPGTTGGALDSNEGLPGPLMIQGDHGPVDFRKMVITPSVN